jgi:hypothetical protein
MPMEKEIAALKDKLIDAEEKIKELEASKVVKHCSSSPLMPRSKLESLKGKNSFRLCIVRILPVFAGHCGSQLYPSYLGGRDWEDHSLRPAQAKKLLRLHFSQ